MTNFARFSIVLLLLIAGLCVWRASSSGPISEPKDNYRQRLDDNPDLPTWNYSGQVADLVKEADSLQVRLAETSWTTVELSEHEPLISIDDLGEIGQLNRMIRFEKTQPEARCGCIGLLQFCWYKNSELIASGSLIHAHNFRFLELPGDARLTPESCNRLKKWLLSKGLTEELIVNPPFPE